jgi:hypothetical protein
MATAFALACASNEDEVALVRPELYESKECWFDEGGNFVAFLILANEGRLAVPHLVSAKCIVNEGYSSYGESIILHMGTVHIDDRSGSLQRELPGMTISDSTVTDDPLPRSTDKVYYLRARVTRLPDAALFIYSSDRVIELRDTHISFEQFLGLSREDRETLLINQH